ncbi:hypothetical protein DA2_2893 [Desulfovibrio sp. A2]|nr:hypothetical protein DA2_2893 [Desulfovibrio sp. A2]
MIHLPPQCRCRRHPAGSLGLFWPEREHCHEKNNPGDRVAPWMDRG